MLHNNILHSSTATGKKFSICHTVNPAKIIIIKRGKSQTIKSVSSYKWKVFKLCCCVSGAWNTKIWNQVDKSEISISKRIFWWRSWLFEH